MRVESIGAEKLPSVIQDPFKKSQVTEIVVRYEENIFNRPNWESYGYVYFKNGDTKGEQRFKGATFDEVVLKIKAFLETLQ